MITPQEKIEEVKKRVNQNNLYIKRIPKKTRKEFIEWAKEEFDGDFGFAIKWLLDFKSGLLSNPNQILADQIEVLTQEIEQLKSVPKEETKKKVIRSISGDVIAEKKGE